MIITPIATDAMIIATGNSGIALVPMISILVISLWFDGSVWVTYTTFGDIYP